MLIKQCPMEEYENIVLAFKIIAVAITRPQDEQTVTGPGTTTHFSD